MADLAVIRERHQRYVAAAFDRNADPMQVVALALQVVDCVPALTADVERLQTENRRLRAQLNTVQGHLRLAVDCLRTVTDD